MAQSIFSRISTLHRGLAAFLLCLPLLLAGCDQAEKQTVAEDVAHPESPEIATRDTETAAGQEEPVPLMDPEEAELDIPNPEEPVLGAIAMLEPTEGHAARGKVTFRYEGGVVTISGTISGLEPGTHGFHIHEFGDCSAPDASSAGGHFAPDGDPHGPPDSDPSMHHVGDLGNIIANLEGVAHFDLTDSEMTLSFGRKSIVGRSVVVHQGADDFGSQPSGAAGPRIACGVIKEAQLD